MRPSDSRRYGRAPLLVVSLRSLLLTLLASPATGLLPFGAAQSKTQDKFSKDLVLSHGNVLNQYMIERNVTIRSVSWDKSRSADRDCLLQVYEGAAVAPITSIKNSTKASVRAFLEKIESGTDIDIALQSSNGMQVSHSSRSRLELWHSLTQTSKDQLLSKISVEARAGQAIEAAEALHILYLDEHICVVNKPSGILAVPGPRRNPSLATTVFDVIQPDSTLDGMDQMVVHRLDMDTSGILVFALTVPALHQLHSDFRDRRVKKSYHALLAGHYVSAAITEIDVALERDPDHPPFMRIAQPKDLVSALESEVAPDTIDANRNMIIKKFLNSTSKRSWTEMHVKSLEYIHGLPVTRVELTPHTGRTHQLRVHTAALGFPIVGDDIYGYRGEGDCGITHDTNEGNQQIQRQLHELQLPLCLHAHRLSLFHPISKAPMVFQCKSYF